MELQKGSQLQKGLVSVPDSECETEIEKGGEVSL
jgi:hypothetical protein